MRGFSIFKFWPEFSISQQQTNHIIFINFWIQFSTYSLYSILILFLTQSLPLGLGYSQEKAYSFMGTNLAVVYLMPMLGGFIADNFLGIRRAILIGCILVAISFLLVLLSNYTLPFYEDKLFVAAYACIPAASSLLMGTTSSMIAQIHSDNAIKAKAAMTFFYMSINVGGLIATLLAPFLFHSRFGPLSVFAVAFIGKSLAALNFASHYRLYDSVIWGSDKNNLTIKKIIFLTSYLVIIYILTLFAYVYPQEALLIISIGCVIGIGWFLFNTFQLTALNKSKQLLALFLILEAIIFFIIYNQMNTTIILFAKNNSDLQLLGLHVLPAQYQILNPLLIIILGACLPSFYKKFPRFSIPYQFAMGNGLAGLGLLVLAFSAFMTSTVFVNGNYIGLAYILITLGELLVSAIGLSMIGLYCDNKKIAFAMGVWYLSTSLSNTISGWLASFVALPTKGTSSLISLITYRNYYFFIGSIVVILGIIMGFFALFIQKRFAKKGVIIY